MYCGDLVNHSFLWYQWYSLATGCTGEKPNFFLPITMKLSSLVEIGLLIIYHQGTEKN